MLPSIDELKTALTQHVPGASLGADGSIVLVQPNDLLRVCEVLKAAPYYLDYVANLTAVDYPPDPAVPPSAGSATGGTGRPSVVQIRRGLVSVAHDIVTAIVEPPA